MGKLEVEKLSIIGIAKHVGSYVCDNCWDDKEYKCEHRLDCHRLKNASDDIKRWLAERIKNSRS